MCENVYCAQEKNAKLNFICKRIMRSGNSYLAGCCRSCSRRSRVRRVEFKRMVDPKQIRKLVNERPNVWHKELFRLIFLHVFEF